MTSASRPSPRAPAPMSAMRWAFPPTGRPAAKTAFTSATTTRAMRWSCASISCCMTKSSATSTTRSASSAATAAATISANAKSYPSATRLPPAPRRGAFGLRDGCVAFLSHCGSRGLGHNLAAGQFRALQEHFSNWSIPLPGNDRELVYAPLGTPEADAYIDDMSLGANFATVNHLLINAHGARGVPGGDSRRDRRAWSISSATTSPAGRWWITSWPGCIARARPAPSPRAITA